MRDTDVERAAAHLTSELGDVLFDALMCVRIAQRDCGEGRVTLEGVVNAATAKIKRRTPYMREWRTLSDAEGFPATEAEAMKHWKKAKRAEPEHSEHDTSPRWTGGRAVVERERRRRRRFLVLGGLSGMVAVAVAAVVCSRGR